MGTDLLYIAAATALFGLGLGGLILHPSALRRLIAVNVMGLGALMLLVAFAYRRQDAPDPVPHALAITGIVVAAAASALGLILIRRARQADEDAVARRRGGGADA